MLAVGLGLLVLGLAGAWALAFSASSRSARISARNCPV